MNTLETTYGELCGVTAYETYPGGQLKSCMLREANEIETCCGSFTPQHRANEFGERQKKHRNSLAFHRNGQIKSAALQNQVPIKTPLGTFGAELVTFHETGAINRLFPLNGLIDGFWSETHERELAEPMEFDLPVGHFKARVIAIAFYPGGGLKSLTLWPGETIRIQTPIGEMNVRAGFSLHEDGSLRSFEPARPVDIETAIGTVKAFDPDIIGMHADQNSVSFDPDGTLTSLKSVASGIRIRGADGEMTTLQPLELESLTDLSDTRIVPLTIAFHPEQITITGLESRTFVRESHRFEAFPVHVVLSPGCTACMGCGGGCDTGKACENCDGSCGKH